MTGITTGTSAPRGADALWLAGLCVSRCGFTLIYSVYSAMVPLVIVDWRMTAAQAGLVQTAWHIGYLVSLFAVGFLSDRLGAKRVYLATSFAAAGSSVAFGLFADGFLSGFLLYGLAGLCAGGSYTPGLTLIAERFSTGRGRAMGYYLAAASIGYALSLVLAGAVAPGFGWHGAFLASAAGPVIATAVAFASLRTTTNRVHRAPAAAPTGKPIRQVLANRPAMLSIWAYTFHSIELLGLKAWLPAFLAAAAVAGGASAIAAATLGALLTAITYLASAAGGIFGGALSDRLGRTRTMLICAGASLACSFLFGWLLHLPLWLILAAACVYIFFAIADSSVYSTSITELVPAHLTGAAYSVRSVIGQTGGALSPWLMGVVLDLARAAASGESLAWGLAWCALGLMALPGPIASWRLRRMPEARAMAGGRR